MTTAIPRQRISPEAHPHVGDDTFRSVRFCPACDDRTANCQKPACIRAEIDDIVRLDRDEEATDD